MARINLISSPRLDKGPKHHRRALLASILFHALALTSVIMATLIYHLHTHPVSSGSAPGTPSITLEKIVVAAPKPQPTPKPVTPPPVPVATPPSPTPPTVVQTQPPPTPPHETAPAPKPLDQGVPILAVQPVKPTPPAEPAKPAPTHPAVSHKEVAETKSAPKPAATIVSSYAAGPSVLPHPPYPEEAREHRSIGTVIVNVLFDEKGDVARAEIAETSGVPLLDSFTLSYIRQHWHSPAYAGRTVSQPVQYKLEDL